MKTDSKRFRRVLGPFNWRFDRRTHYLRYEFRGCVYVGTRLVRERFVVTYGADVSPRHVALMLRQDCHEFRRRLRATIAGAR